MTASERKKIPAICWLRVTNYMHDWVAHEMCCTLKANRQNIVCLQHLEGVRDIMRMESYEDIELKAGRVENAMSAKRYRVVKAAMEVSETATSRLYGIDREALGLYMPIECPPVCMTKNGVLRKWTDNVCFTHDQATALQRRLRDYFFEQLAEFDSYYAEQMGKRPYPAIDMVEAFCDEKDVNDMYADTIRREWQRRLKRH